MADIDDRRINGAAFSWSSTTWKIGSSRINGFKSINYKDQRDRSPVHGSAKHHAPRGHTAGKYTAEPATATVEVETADAIRAALAKEAGDAKSFGNVEFEVSIQFEESRGGTPKISTHLLHRCTWREAANKSEEGTEALYEEIAFHVTSIERNGVTLYDGTEGAP